jgi:superfamily II DNA or RNA helicase
MVYIFMIEFEIISPSVALIHNYYNDLQELRKELTYRNLTNVYAYNKHKQKRWLKNKDPIAFEEEEKRLKSLIYQNILFSHNGKLATYPGIIPYIKLPHTVTNKIEYPNLKTIPWKKTLPFQPYPYQEEAVQKLLEAKHAHISCATGLGKTLIILMLARNAGVDIVITTPAQSIFADLLKECETHLGKGIVGGYGDGKKDLTKKITVAINRSLSMVKEGTPAWEFFSKKKMLIVDETHSFGSEDLSKTAFGLLKDIPYRLFLSATPIRMDGTQKLLNAIIGECVLDMDLKKGIQGGYLSPLKFKIINTITPNTLDFSDPIEAKRKYFLRNPNIAEIAGRLANANWTVKGENTLILVEELQQIKDIVKHLKVPYGYVHSGSKKEAEAMGLKKVDATEEIEKFNKGETKVLIGTRSVSTGTNMFSHHTINCMGGTSEVATLQGAVGRSTRQTDKSKYAQYHKPKLFCTIYDFNITNNETMMAQLEKRVKYYEQSGEIVVY